METEEFLSDENWLTGGPAPGVGAHLGPGEETTPSDNTDMAEASLNSFFCSRDDDDALSSVEIWRRSAIPGPKLGDRHSSPAHAEAFSLQDAPEAPWESPLCTNRDLAGFRYPVEIPSQDKERSGVVAMEPNRDPPASSPASSPAHATAFSSQTEFSWERDHSANRDPAGSGSPPGGPNRDSVHFEKPPTRPNRESVGFGRPPLTPRRDSVGLGFGRPPMSPNRGSVGLGFGKPPMSPRRDQMVLPNPPTSPNQERARFRKLSARASREIEGFEKAVEKAYSFIHVLDFLTNADWEFTYVLKLIS